MDDFWKQVEISKMIEKWPNIDTWAQHNPPPPPHPGVKESIRKTHSKPMHYLTRPSQIANGEHIDTKNFSKKFIDKLTHEP